MMDARKGKSRFLKWCNIRSQHQTITGKVFGAALNIHPYILAAVLETIPSISSISSSAYRLLRLGIKATASSTSSGFRFDKQAISNSSSRNSTTLSSTSRLKTRDMSALQLYKKSEPSRLCWSTDALTLVTLSQMLDSTLDPSCHWIAAHMSMFSGKHYERFEQLCCIDSRQRLFPYFVSCFSWFS